MSVETILWPTDLSTQSKETIEQIVSLSKMYDARVVVLYSSVDPGSYFPAFGDYPGSNKLNDLREWEVEQAREVLNELCETELKNCPETIVRLEQGDPAETILEYIHKEQADLIVMASHGLGHEKRGGTPKQLGSVADAIVKNSFVPVHLVKTL